MSYLYDDPGECVWKKMADLYALDIEKIEYMGPIHPQYRCVFECDGLDFDCDGYEGHNEIPTTPFT